MDNPLLKYSAKEYFFKAALCHFIVDELNAKVSYPRIPNPSPPACWEKLGGLRTVIPKSSIPPQQWLEFLVCHCHVVDTSSTLRMGRQILGKNPGMAREGISSLFQLALEKYEEMFPAFTDSRECKLLKVSNQGAFSLFQGFSPLSQSFRGHRPRFSLGSAQRCVCGGCFPWISVPWDEMPRWEHGVTAHSLIFPGVFPETAGSP